MPTRSASATRCSGRRSSVSGGWDAGLRRRGGELLWREPSLRDEARRDLRLALDVARKQKARMLELRTAISMNRLLQNGDSGGRTGGMLAGIYGSFTEGLDTPDLAE